MRLLERFGRVVLVDDSDKERALGSEGGLPIGHGAVAWTIDPVHCVQQGTQANVHLGSVFLKKGTIIGSMGVIVTVAGVAVTTAWWGIYDKNCNLLAQSGNSAADRTAMQGTGLIIAQLTQDANNNPLPGGQWVCPADDLYYFGTSQTASTTLPTLLNFTQNGINATMNGPGKYPYSRGCHCQTAGATLPNPAVPQGSFSNFPCIMGFPS